MAKEITDDEVNGRAEQLELPGIQSLGAVETQFKVTRLLEELDLVPADLLASVLGVAEQTLAGWRCNKLGPDFVKLGKGVFYRREDIKAWIAQSVVSPAVAA
jgi:hypothetical protein